MVYKFSVRVQHAPIVVLNANTNAINKILFISLWESIPHSNASAEGIILHKVKYNACSENMINGIMQSVSHSNH